MPRPFVQRYETRSGNPRYRAWYYDAVGWKIGKVFHTQREARSFLDERAREAASGQLVDSRAGQVTLATVWDERRAREEFAAAPLASQDNVWRVVGPALGHRPIGDIKTTDVDRALGTITAPSAQKKARSVLVAVFNYAVAEGRIAINPAKARRRSTTHAAKTAAGASSVEKVRRLNGEELAALIGEVPPRYAMLVELSARVGLRPGEVLALTFEQFDAEARILRIDRSVSPPTSRSTRSTGSSFRHARERSGTRSPPSPWMSTGSCGRRRRSGSPSRLTQQSARVKPRAPVDPRRPR